MLEKYTNGDADNHPFGWQPEDFRDDGAGQAAESDPWAASSDEAELRDAPDFGRAELPAPVMVDLGSAEGNHSDADSESLAFTAEEGSPVASDGSDAAEMRNEQVPIDDEISALDADGVEGWDGDLDYDEVDSEYDEPIPFAEYDYDLREPLHVTDVADTDIWKKVRIDEFVSGVSGVSIGQRTRIVELLEDMGQSRLLSWLSQYDDWTGHSLILFLEFRVIWEDTPHWWESRFWWQWYGGWWSYYNSGNLSRDWMRDLVLRRLHCSAEEVVDDVWFAEWENGEMWGRGFPTFAGFALFRAEIGEDEDWLTSLGSLEGDNQADGPPTPYKLFLQSEEIEALTESAYEYRVNEDYSPYRGASGAPQWFAIQDWYDPSEWHDNLGWAQSWSDGIGAYSTHQECPTYHLWSPDMSDYFLDGASDDEA